jgi:carboxymethylenebutenolidase
MKMNEGIATETVTIPVDVGSPPMAAYLARPAAEGRFPVCIVCPEIFGLTHHVRDAAERLAREGYLAIVPDFSHRTEPGAVFGYDEDGRTRGLALLRQLRRLEVLDDLAAIMRYVRERRDARAKIAVLGFSAGGHIAYLAATTFDVAAIVSLYGGWLADTDIPLSQPEPTIALTPGIARHGARILYIVGADDHLITPDQRAAIEQALTAAKVRHELVVYASVKHGFLFDGRPAFDAAAADDAWRRILALLADELSPATIGKTS